MSMAHAGGVAKGVKPRAGALDTAIAARACCSRLRAWERATMADPPPKKTPPPSPVTSSKNKGMGVLARRPDVFFDASDDVCPTPAWFSAATPRFTDILDDLKKWL